MDAASKGFRPLIIATLPWYPGSSSVELCMREWKQKLPAPGLGSGVADYYLIAFCPQRQVLKPAQDQGEWTWSTSRGGKGIQAKSQRGKKLWHSILGDALIISAPSSMPPTSQDPVAVTQDVN